MYYSGKVYYLDSIIDTPSLSYSICYHVVERGINNMKWILLEENNTYKFALGSLNI